MGKNTLNLLFDFNPWWQEGDFKFAEEELFPKRNLYNHLIDELNLRQITAILGLRRVGKTTLLKQIINSLLKNTPDKKKIAFFSFEESLVAYKKDLLEEML